VRVGDFVLAGYPANIGQSATSGIVSGLHRSNIGIKEFENFIQTYAAVYPGNSGGALVDLHGDLVASTPPSWCDQQQCRRGLCDSGQRGAHRHRSDRGSRRNPPRPSAREK
jgi:hypothetical protein